MLKTDVLGRVKTSGKQREAMLDEFERSGLSGTKFAAVAGVNYQTFAILGAEAAQGHGSVPSGSKAFQPEEVFKAGSGSGSGACAGLVGGGGG